MNLNSSAVSSLITKTVEKLRNDILNGKLIYGTLLPTEKELAESLNVSRPTVAKMYNILQREGLIRKRPGYGTTVTLNINKKSSTYGLLLPGSAESEIFGIMNDQFLEIEKEGDKTTFLWDGTVANNAEKRQNSILKI